LGVHAGFRFWEILSWILRVRPPWFVYIRTKKREPGPSWE